jgi:ribosome-interacting GTPase 1
MAKTQKNKATSFHLGQLKAKLSKLKKELLVSMLRVQVSRLWDSLVSHQWENQRSCHV